MSKTSIFVLACLLLVGMMSPAYAYIDPGSGSVLTSAIIGFFAAAAYTGRKYFYRLKDALFGRHPKATDMGGKARSR